MDRFVRVDIEFKFVDANGIEQSEWAKLSPGGFPKWMPGGPPDALFAINSPDPDALPWRVIAEKTFGENAFEIDDWFDAEARQYGLDFYVGYGSKAKDCQKMLFELEHPDVRITGVRVRLKVMDFTDANLSMCIKKYNKAKKDSRRKASDRHYAKPFEVPPESPRELLQAAEFAFNTYGDAEMYVKAMKSAMAGVKWCALAPELRKLVECYRRYGGRELIGKSAVMCELRDKIDRIAPFDKTRVLIVAETGTGKETVAQQLHLKSPRRDMPFVAFNCASVNPSLLESRFFGHEKGAFTDAKERSIGLFEQAKGGTLFLDEIGELDANAQSLLLRVLEGGRFTRLGGKEEILADVRLVTATNRDLPKMVHDGKFRLDLYERLNIVQLRIPPLRDHKEDIMDIAIDWRFKHDRRLFSEVSMERPLLEYDYPGNVRELINILEKSKIFQEDDFEKLMAEHRLMNKGLVDEVQSIDNKIIDDCTVPEDLDGATRHHVRRIFEKYGKNLTKTAEVLKVSRNTVRKYM